MGEVVGIDADDNDSVVDADGNLVAEGIASAMQTADASATTGPAVAAIGYGTPDSEFIGEDSPFPQLSNDEVIGAAFSTGEDDGLDVRGDVTVTGTATIANNASASSTTGDVLAADTFDTATGLIDDLLAGGDATITGTADVTGTAKATTTDGDAFAFSGQDRISPELNGEDGFVENVVLPAAEALVGYDPYGSSVIGYDAEGNVEVGGDAEVTGNASTNNTAEATAESGNAVAEAGNSQVIGIKVNETLADVIDNAVDSFGDTVGEGQLADAYTDSFIVAGDGTFVADASSTTTTTAATTTGDASTLTDSNDVIGLNIGRSVTLDGEDSPLAYLSDELADEIDPASGDRFQVRGDASIDAKARFEGKATSSASTGNAEAIVDSDDVTGINSTWEDVIVDGDADIYAAGVNVQAANASTSTGNADASAASTGVGFDIVDQFLGSEETVGSNDTDYFIKGDATQFKTAGVLDAKAEANAVTGDATAEAGRYSETIGFESDLRGEVNIAGSATGAEGITTYGYVTLNSEAETSTGDATASSDAVVIKGAENMDLDVAGNIDGTWGALALAQGEINATATSVNGEETAAVIDAYSKGFDSSVFGLESPAVLLSNPGPMSGVVDNVMEMEPTMFGDIDIQGSGNVTQVAELLANAQASTTGDSEDDTVTASVDLDSVGGDYLFTDGDISIGGSGTVLAEGINEGSVAATGVTADAIANANVNAEGLRLDDSTVSIGGSGSTIGKGWIGGWEGLQDGSHANTGAFKVTAETVTGDATANFDEGPATFDAIGLGGSEGSMITAGPSGGSIIGVAGAAADISASTTNGDAVSESASDLFGIQSVDLQAGQSGSIDGVAQGIFTTSSSSVNGNADAASTVRGIGLDGMSNTITGSESITAIAEISNTVTASTVTGSANAMATGSAIGLQGYEVSMNGDGVIDASVSANIVARASTITSGSSDL